MMKQKKFWLIIGILCVVLAVGYHVFICPRWELPVLMYHYIDTKDGSLYVTPQNFERQMKYLKKRGFHVISLAEFVDGIKRHRAFDRKTVVITFDDGHRDNYTNAFPVLKEYGFPAVFFVETGFIGDDEYLTAQQIKEMAAQNMTFGGHTQNNKYLPDLPEERVIYEVNASKQDLEKILGREIYFFAYPVGGFNEQVKQAVREAGFIAALTTNRGVSRAHSDMYALKRVKVTNSDAVKAFHFWGKLSGYYNLFRKAR